MKHQPGFTLLELIVSIVIIGILSAIAVPSFLSQRVKAQQAEAKQIIGVISRWQSSFYHQHERFGTETDAEAEGHTLSSSSYNFTIALQDDAASIQALPNSIPSRLRSYVAVVGLVLHPDPAIKSATCESIQPNSIALTQGGVSTGGDQVVCPANYFRL